MVFVRYQKRFNVQTPFKIRDAALSSDLSTLNPIPENKRIMKWKAEDYSNNTCLA